MAQDFIGRKLPSDPHAEKVVLGAILSGHPQTAELFEMLTVEDFEDKRHQVIFKAMKRLWDEAHPVELPGVYDELVRSEQMKNPGEGAYLASLGDPVPTKMRTDLYAVNMRKSLVAREFIENCESWEETVFDGGNIGEVLDTAREKISSLCGLSSQFEQAKNFRDASINLLARLKDAENIRLMTGLSGVDEKTGGFCPGELVIITAETGVGKTFFALQIARNSCQQGRHLLYCSGEMLAEHLMGRVLTSQSGITYSKIRNPSTIRDDEYFKLIELATKQCSECRIMDGELNLPSIRLAARTMPPGTFGGLIVDYDELVEVRGKDEWEQQRILVRSLKSLAMELKIPVLVVSQLRKALNPEERKNPTLQRLYGSGAKAKHASIVLYVDRPYVQELTGDETVAFVYVLKSRDGRMGKTECSFNVRTLNFEMKGRAS